MKPMTYEQYSKLDAINWSTLKSMAKSPLHYKWELDHPREDSVRFALGRGTHTAVLEPMRFLRDYVLWEGGRRQGKKWDEYEAANAHKTILKPEEYQRCLDAAEAVKAHPEARRYLQIAGLAEHVLEWTDPTTGMACKARPDWQCELATVDIKTCKTTEMRSFASTVARLGYHGQAAFYAGGRAIARNEAVKPFVIIAVEMEAPHDVQVYELDADAMYAGERDYMAFLAKVKECREAGRWPGRSDKLESLAVPAWVFGDEEGLTATEVAEEAA